MIARHPALLIAGLYLLFGLLWILFSDQAIEWLAGAMRHGCHGYKPIKAWPLW